MKKNLYFKLVRYLVITFALTGSNISFLSAMEQRQQEQAPTLSAKERSRQQYLQILNERRKELITEIEILDDAITQKKSTEHGKLLELRLEKAWVDYWLCEKLRDDPQPSYTFGSTGEYTNPIPLPINTAVAYPVLMPILQWVEVMVMQRINPPPIEQLQMPSMSPAASAATMKAAQEEPQAAASSQTETQTSTQLPTQQKDEQPTTKPYRTPDGRTYTNVAAIPIQRSNQMTEKPTVSSAQPIPQTPRTPITKKPLPQAQANPIGAKAPTQKAPKSAPAAIKINKPAQEPKHAPAATETNKHVEQQQKQEEKKHTPSASTQEPVHEKEANKQSSDEKDDDKATTSQPQEAKQPSQEATFPELWQQGIQLLKQKETLCQAIDLLEQALPITTNDDCSWKPNEGVEQVMNTFNFQSDNLLFQALIIRIGIVLGGLDSKKFDSLIQAFLKAIDRGQLAKVPSNQSASILFIQGFIFYTGFYTEKSQEKAVAAFASALNNPDISAHIRAEVRDLLKIIASPITQQKFSGYNSIYDLGKPWLSSAIEACYLLVPLLIAQNDVPSAAIAYRNAAIVHISLIKEQRGEALFSTASAQAKRALEIRAFQKTQKPVAERSRKQENPQQDFIEKREKLGALAALCNIEINRYLDLKQKDNTEMIDKLKKAFLAKADIYSRSSEIASDDIYKDLLSGTYGTIAAYYSLREAKSVIIQYLRIAHDLSPYPKVLLLLWGNFLLQINPVGTRDVKEGLSMLTSLIEEGPEGSSISDTCCAAAYDLGLYYDPMSGQKIKGLKKDESLALHYFDLAAKAGFVLAIQYMAKRTKQQKAATRPAFITRDAAVAQIIERFKKILTVGVCLVFLYALKVMVEKV